MKEPKPKPYLKPALEKVTLELGGSLFTPEMIEKMVASINKSSVVMSKLAATLGATLPPVSNPWAYGTVWRNRVSDATVMAVGYRQIIGINGACQDPPIIHHTTEEWTQYWEPVA